MTSTDLTPLQERIAESFCEPTHRSRWPLALVNTYCGQCWEKATTVLPIVAEEVRKAKVEAWDEGYLDRSPYGGRAQSRADNPYRYETGDQ